MSICKNCHFLKTTRVGDSFDRAEYCYCNKSKKVIDSYLTIKETLNLPKWCELYSRKEEK